MIDKFNISLGLLALGARLLAQVTAAQVPELNAVANLTAVGALIWLVLRTMPKILDDHRQERTAWFEHMRSELKDLRSTFRCNKDEH